MLCLSIVSLYCQDHSQHPLPLIRRWQLLQPGPHPGTERSRSDCTHSTSVSSPSRFPGFVTYYGSSLSQISSKPRQKWLLGEAPLHRDESGMVKVCVGWISRIVFCFFNLPPSPCNSQLSDLTAGCVDPQGHTAAQQRGCNLLQPLTNLRI